MRRDDRGKVQQRSLTRLTRERASSAPVHTPRGRRPQSLATVAHVTGNLLDGWRAQEYGRSRDGVALRVFLPAADRPAEGLLVAAQHGEEAVTALVARRLLERVPGRSTGWLGWPSTPGVMASGMLSQQAALPCPTPSGPVV